MPYADQHTKALRLLNLAEKDADQALQARALIRLAYIELTTGKWGPEWEDWKQQAEELASKLPNSSIAKQEVRGYGGFLKGFYFKQLPQGLQDLRAAIAFATELKETDFLARALYLVGRLQAIDGQPMLAFESLYLSAMVARSSDNYDQEWYSLNQLVMLQDGFEYEVDKSTVDRIHELCDLADFETPTQILPLQERIKALRRSTSTFEQLKNMPPTEIANELQQIAICSRKLAFIAMDARDWKEAKVAIDVWSECARRNGNDPMFVEADIMSLLLQLRCGEDVASTEILDRYLMLMTSLSLERKISALCRQVAQELEIVGKPQQAIDWRAAANKYAHFEVTGANSRRAAKFRFDAMLGNRQRTALLQQ